MPSLELKYHQANLCERARSWILARAAGYLLNAARLQFNVEGLELNRSAAAFAREKLKVPVAVMPWDEWKPGHRFSVITMVWT